jgi:pimeloyl-ACP methyl ester carboxylesterase
MMGISQNVPANDQRRGRIVEPTRLFTTARVVALVLIALVVLGLAYLRFAPGTGAVSVPAGAHAGDLTLKPCSYATENGSYDADCGTLVVPENRANPRSRLIALPVTRIRARSAHPAEPIFRLEGGPGKTNMQFSKASRLADNHDVVLVGYRGADGSSVLNCPEVTSALKHSADFLSEQSFHAYADAFRSCAKRLQADGVDLAGYSLPQQVDDLDAARVALGYKRIDLVSESAGTRVAMIYAWRYPKSIHRSAMIAVNPPGNFLWDPQTTDEQIRYYAHLCAQNATCRTRTADLAASLRHTAATIPGRWLLLPIKTGNARLASFYGLMESTQEAAPLAAANTLDSWLSAAEGDPSGFWLQSTLADLFYPPAFIWGEMAAVARADTRAAERYFSSGAQRGDSILGNPGTEFLWAGGGLLWAWPANPGASAYDRVRMSTVETLLIGGTVDFATPAQNATKELLPYLPNGHQVVLAELGHATDFWSYEPQASTRLLTTFFDSGTVDASLYTHRTMDFTPEVTLTWLAKIIAGVMIGFAALAVLSLLLMAGWVKRRGGFGHKASVALRSAYPLVLGLGGWCLGVLVVMTTLPTVPLDDEVLAVLSVGVPIGLGIYLAWVNGDQSAETKATGFAAAAGGALVGAWLGFHASAGLFALITGIVGATAGANLILLALDIWRDRQVREPDMRYSTGYMGTDR